jgi:NADH dehydrogenase [ubiquinone] 1 alpha subcomplex assembly factor 6
MMTIPGYVKQVRNQTPVPGQRSQHAVAFSPVAALVRRHDRDRYQTALFAPAARREALFALYAFNYEIARVRELVTQPVLGLLRLEWWRENIAAAFGSGPVRHHPVVEALSGAAREYRLTRSHLDRLIEARKADFEDEPPADLAALEAYAEGTSSQLIYSALEVLGVRDGAATAAARHVGIAFALSGLLRALPLRVAGAHPPLIPAELAARRGLDRVGGRPTGSSPELRAVIGEIATAAEAHLGAARQIDPRPPRAALPALLPAVIAEGSLRRLQRAGYDPADPAVQRGDPLQSWRLAAAMLRRRF